VVSVRTKNQSGFAYFKFSCDRWAERKLGLLVKRVSPKASHPVNSNAAPQKAEGGKFRRSTLRNNYFTFASAQMQNAHAEPPRVGEMKLFSALKLARRTH